MVVHEIPVPPAEAAGGRAAHSEARSSTATRPSRPSSPGAPTPTGCGSRSSRTRACRWARSCPAGRSRRPRPPRSAPPLLSGVAALHEAGIAMGGFGAAAVRITGNGEVRLAGHPAGAVRGAPSPERPARRRPLERHGHLRRVRRRPGRRARPAEHPARPGGDDALDGERRDGPGGGPRAGRACARWLGPCSRPTADGGPEPSWRCAPAAARCLRSRRSCPRPKLLPRRRRAAPPFVPRASR